MTPPWITRVATLCAAGHGLDALAAAVAAGHPLTRPAPWAWEGLTAPRVARIPPERFDPPDERRAEALLDAVVREVLPAGAQGVGLIVGTSSGAICGGFEAWRRSEGRRGRDGSLSTPIGILGRGGPPPATPPVFLGQGGPPPATPPGIAPDFATDVPAWRQLPTRAVAARHGLGPVLTTSVACASGAMIFVLARAWLRAGLCERVIVAGVDTLSLYIHAGFAGLGALSPTVCRPFTTRRDGLLLGEGAAAFLVETPHAAIAAGRTPLATLLGVGMSQDGLHLTAPDRTGDGLYRAAAAALSDAGLPAAAVDTVSAHGTGTLHNDAMEARALSRLFGGLPVPLHLVKPVIGHTLGAAGALEVAELLALFGGAPAPLPPADLAEDCPIQVTPTRAGPHGRPRLALTVNAAFGGVNVALVLGAGDASSVGRPSASAAVVLPPRSPPDVHLSGDHFPLATLLGPEAPAPPTLGRADTYVRAGIAALARAHPAPDTPIVLSSESGCAAADLRYYDGLLRDGPARASRVHFAYTTPGAPLAEAAILLHLRGPAIVVCGTAADGATTARALVASELAPTLLHLHVEAPATHADSTVTRYSGAPS